MNEKAKILIVEDEEELTEVLEYNLQSHGYSTLVAYDGQTACRMAEDQSPDLILLDILLPDLDGWEICKLIRSHPDENRATVPIIMLTALGAGEDRIKGLELGADAYIPKPYAVREVLVRAKNLIEKRRKQNGIAGEIAGLRKKAALQSDMQNMLMHEMRNHMLVIQGFSARMGKNLGDAAQEKRASYADAILRSSGYLSNLAEGFLLVGKLESGILELPVEVIDLGAILEETMPLYKPMAEEKEISLRVERDLPVNPAWSNPAAAKLVLSNLLDNALKYSPGKMPVEVRLQMESESLAIHVRDYGPGIPAGEADRVFEKFYRCPATENSSRGSGLGLYLSRILTRAMAGSIEVKSKLGEGACFSVRFPAWKGGDRYNRCRE